MLGERSKIYFHHGYNCGETVVKVFKEQYDFLKDIPVSMGLGFGGGCGGSGNICGALLSATAILSMASFKERENVSKEEKDAFYKNMQGLYGKVEVKYGSIQCRELKKCPEDGKRLCPLLVADIIDFTEEELERGK